MADIKKTFIPQRLKNPSADHPYVAGSVDIFDDNSKRNQEEINADTYRKNETYNKEQIEHMAATHDENFVNLEAHDGDTLSDIFDGIEGAPQTLYRVANWDGEQYNTAKYTQYSFDGTNFVPLQVVNAGIDKRPTKDSSKLVESGGVFSWSKENTVEETTTLLSDDDVVAYLIDKKRCILAKITKSGAIERIVKNSEDLKIEELENEISYLSKNLETDENILWYLTDNTGKVIATIDNTGKIAFLGGGGFDGEETVSRPVEMDAVKILTDRKNKVLGWITSAGKLHIVDLEAEHLSIDNNSDIGIPEQLFPIIGFIANGTRMMNFINDKTYNLLFSSTGKYQKKGTPIETTPMLAIQDDDTMDYQIPVSLRRGATDDTQPRPEDYNKGGYISLLLPLTMALNARYGTQINAEKNKIVIGCAAEGQRIGLTPLYGHEDTFTGELNVNGKIFRKVIEHEGWEALCHSMTARYLEENYIVDGLDSTFAQLILENGNWGGDLHWSTTTCYNTADGKNYQIKQDKSGWDELPLHYVKPYCYIYIEVEGVITVNENYQEHYNSGIRVVINPTYSVKYQVNTWFERAKEANLPYLDRAGINWGNSHTVWHMKESLKYADFFFGRYAETNRLPLDTIIHRYDYTPHASRNGAGNIENYNVYTELEYERLIKAIDSCIDNKSLTVLFSHASTPSNVNYYLSGLTYPTERTGDRLNYTDSNYPDSWKVPLRWNELQDMLNDPDCEYWTVPPLMRRNQDGTLSNERMESWAEWYPCPGTTLALLYDVLRYAISQGVRFASSKECISMFANVLSIGIKSDQGTLWTADPLLGDIPEENQSYCIIGADGSVDYNSYK